MDQGPLQEQIVAMFDTMPRQMRVAARYVLDHPSDVALLSMREQARQAGVLPATMTRLAQRLGFDGFDALRETYAEAVRGGHVGFAGQAGAQVASQKLKGNAGQAAEMVKTLDAQIAGLADPAAIETMVAAASSIARARNVYCLGLRSSHAVAWHVHYVLSLIGRRSVFLDGFAGVGLDPLALSGRRDVLFVVSVLPYTRVTVEAAEHAKAAGLRVVAVTDSEVAPLAQLADDVVHVPTASPSFFHTMTPALAVAEIITAIVAGILGDAAVEALRRADAHQRIFNVHVRPRAAKR